MTLDFNNPAILFDFRVNQMLREIEVVIRDQLGSIDGTKADLDTKILMRKLIDAIHNLDKLTDDKLRRANEK